jgi:hypothetical protein
VEPRFAIANDLLHDRPSIPRLKRQRPAALFLMRGGVFQVFAGLEIAKIGKSYLQLKLSLLAITI